MAIAAHVPDPLRTGPFRASDAVGAGLLTRRQLDGGPWRRLLRGVYVHEGVVPTHRVRCQAAALILPPGAVVSGASAAYLLGADVIHGDPPVEVTVSRGGQMRAQPGLIVRCGKLRHDDLIARGRIPVTRPVRTAFDVARHGDLDEAVVAVDALLHACRLRVDAIAAYANDGRANWHGAGRLAGVLSLTAVGAESPMETRLRLVLVRAGLPAPVLQHRVKDTRGAVVARVDLAYPERRLGIEYDGEHHWSPESVRRDLRRQNALRALGWTLLRFTADDVLHHPARLAAQATAAAT